MQQVLMVDYEKCTGCRTCEQVCAASHYGVVNPAKSCIRVVKWEQEGLYIPMICQQCEDAPCMKGCPVGAISRDPETDHVKVDYNTCIGCRTCVTVCPFGAMNYNPDEKKVFKCDLCGGDPQCVRFCDIKAVYFPVPEDMSGSKKRKAAKRFKAAAKQAHALQG
jgi:carbon-monoxide dehydrogenase iron sulfur subunit